MVSFKSTLASAFNSVLTVLGMAPPPETYAEVTSLSSDPSVGINTYYNSIHTLYNDSGTARMHDLIVEEVDLCKQPASPEHEYIFAKVKPRPGAIERDPFCVTLERFMGGPMVRKNTQPTGGKHDSSTSTSIPSPSTQPSEQASPHRPSLLKTLSESAVSVSEIAEMLSNGSSAVRDASTAVSDKIRDPRLADDRITLQVNHYGDRRARADNVCYRLKFSDESPLYFYELVTLARAVNNAEQQYLLVDGQCYYYAGSIISALRDVSIDTSDYKPYGNYKLLTIYSENKLKVLKLIEQYSEAKAAFETKVSDIEKAKLGMIKENLDVKQENIGMKKELNDKNISISIRDNTIDILNKMHVDKDKKLANKDKKLADTNKQLADMNKQLAEREAEIAELRRLLAKQSADA